MPLAVHLPYPVNREVWDTDTHDRPGSYFDSTEKVQPGTHWLQLVLSGRQVIRLRDRNQACRPGDITLFLRGEPCEYVATSRRLRTLSIFFQPAKGDDILEYPEAKPPAATNNQGLYLPHYLPESPASGLQEPFHQMHQLCLRRSASRDPHTKRLLDWQTRTLLDQILLQLATAFAPRSPSLAQPAAIRRVIRALTRYPERPYSQAEMAELSGLPASTLNRQFRKATGWSIKQYQTRLRIQRVRQILRDEPETGLMAIAERTGFYDEFHLSKTFKQQMGLTPSEFRLKVATTTRSSGYPARTRT